MYKDLRNQKKIDFIVKVKRCVTKSNAAPTIFNFVDVEDTPYYFKLHHGYARIVCEENEEMLIANTMDNFDNFCCWHNVVDWAKINGVLLEC